MAALQWAGNLSMFIFNIICDIYVLDMFLNNVFKWNLYVSDILDKIYFLLFSLAWSVATCCPQVVKVRNCIARITACWWNFDSCLCGQVDFSHHDNLKQSKAKRCAQILDHHHLPLIILGNVLCLWNYADLTHLQNHWCI